MRRIRPCSGNPNTAWAGSFWREPMFCSARTDVLLRWRHPAPGQVAEDVVDRVQRLVPGEKGLPVLRSGHFSKIFIRLMGTTCSLLWRNEREVERIWTAAPAHPTAKGIPRTLIIDERETDGEFFDIPTPDEFIVISSPGGGEVFRRCSSRGC